MANIAVDVTDKLLSAIGATAKKVKTTALTVKANKLQSKRLAERVDTVAGFLTGQAAAKMANSSMRPQLESFHSFLQGCDTFIGKFGGKHWFSRIYANKNHADKFHQLNIDLDRYVSDFSLGLQINIFNTLTPEDKRDAQLDQVEINQIISTHSTRVPAPVLPLAPVPGPPAVPTPVRATVPVPVPVPVQALGVPVQLAPSVQPNANSTGTARLPIPVRPNNAPANKLKRGTQDRNYYGQFGFLQPNNFMHNYYPRQHLQRARHDSMYPHHQLTFSRKRYNSILPSHQFAYHMQMPNPHIMNPLHR
ncbi:unnamed protein product [Adineta ricciae]|uniref:Mixed lineage kinase domain-containing protein n=1 Tax=Adineta ricciae TaxID=249248 RepID=A0A814UDL8_ADIRI|nr:unnamed protein product [Adineta ricciae]